MFRKLVMTDPMSPSFTRWIHFLIDLDDRLPLRDKDKLGRIKIVLPEDWMPAPPHPFLISCIWGFTVVIREYPKPIAERVSKRDWQGNRCLHYAANCGHLEVVRLLLNAGADVNASNKEIQTALLLSALNGHFTVVELLLDQGAIIHHQDKYGRTLLQFAAFNGNADIVQKLVEHDTDTTTHRKEYEEALYLGALTGCGAMVGHLPLAGASPNGQTGPQEMTALHIAAKFGDAAMVQMLVDYGAELDAKAYNGVTPLHEAARWGHVSVLTTKMP